MSTVNLSGASAVANAVHHFTATWSEADRHARGLPAQHPSVACAAAYLGAVLSPDHPRTQSALPALRRDVADAMDVLGASGFPALMGGPWRVALLDPQPHAENGLPHTHADVICLPVSMYEGGEPFGRPPSRAERVRTLIHERVHVFQRAQPEATQRLIRERLGGMAPITPTPALPHWLADRRRSNPDLDGRLWSADGGRTTVVQLYDSPNGWGGLSASRPHRLIRAPEGGWHLQVDDGNEDNELHEHPYEAMAYRIAAACTV